MGRILATLLLIIILRHPPPQHPHARLFHKQNKTPLLPAIAKPSRFRITDLLIRAVLALRAQLRLAASPIAQVPMRARVAQLQLALVRRVIARVAHAVSARCAPLV
eukprot:2306989-Rhodomonas_salina.4